MMHSITGNKFKRTAGKILPLILLLLIWQAVSWKIGKTYIVPTPYETLKELIKILSSPASLTDIAYTIARMAVSFSISLTAGVLLAVSSYRLKAFRSFLDPVMTIIKSVPTMGVILLSLIWFGSGGTVLFVCSLIVMPLIYNNVFYGLKSVDVKLVEMASFFNFSRAKKTRYIYWPSLKPFLNPAVAAGISLNMKVLIAAEVLGQPDKAIGTNLFNAKAVINTPGIFAWSIIVILLAFTIERNILSRKHTKRS